MDAHNLQSDGFRWLSNDEFFSQLDAAWSRLSDAFRKLEVCPVFNEDGDESFELFVTGDLAAARESVSQRVLKQAEMYQQAMDSGASINRLRIVGRPVTPYIADYELAAYHANTSIGEKISYLAEAHIPDELQSFCRDMLLFDEREILIHEYTPWGRMLGGWYSDDHETVKRYSARIQSLFEMGVLAFDSIA